MIGFGVSTWHSTQQRIAHELSQRAQRFAKQESTALDHWAFALRALGNLVVLDDTPSAAGVDTRIALFQSSYPETFLPILIVEAQNHHLMGSSPIALPALQSPYLRVGRTICPGNAGKRLTLGAPMPGPAQASAPLHRVVPACISIRDASGDAMLDVIALLPWVSHPRTINAADDRVAGHRLDCTLTWAGLSHGAQSFAKTSPDTSGQTDPSPPTENPSWISRWFTNTYGANGAPIHPGQITAWAKVAHYPLRVVTSLPTSAIWHDWLSHGGAGEGFVLTLLLATALGMSAWRFARLAREESLLRRYYGALRGINRTLLHNPEPEKLYRMTCARLVEGADLPLAWIGIQQGTHMRVRAVSGTARGYVDGLELDMAEGSPTAQGPVGQAVHHANTIVIADLQRDGSFILWQQRAAHYGLRSLVAVPFTTEAGDPGVLAAYAQQADYFSAPLIQLMEELAGDVALGVNQFDHLQAITRLSQQDPLTGLPNRAYFMRALKQAIGRTDRADRLTGIGILDLDYFKQINDSLGHHIGDMVITHLATELNQAVRQGDTVARLGGDEFGILLEGIADAEELDHIASRLLAAVRKPICIEGIEAALKTDASLGLTLYPFDGGTPADLLRHADAALYAVKGSGRHRWQLFHRDMASLAKQEYLIHQRMPAALLENRLIFYFQPQINLQTGEIIGIEALIRWQDPVSGMWMPKAFMPVVEADTGLSRSLGCYCLNAAAMAITRWLSDGLAFGRLSVNICARHLQHSGFLEDLSSVLLRYPVVAEHLSIELTETQALADLDKSARMLSEVRALGVHVDLDDFGSGYASLQYVRELPLDTIKLDLQFVQNLEHDTEALSVGYAALSLAEMHGAEVIAEGVETERIARLWQRLGGRVIQGYLGAKPMPESELIAWLSAYAPDRRFATTPHWRSTPEVLTLLQALPFHSQYIARLRGAMTESPLSSDTLNGLVKTWRAPCPITEWLSSTDAIPYDTVALKQAHDHLHESIGSIINALSSDPSSHGDVEGLEKAWDHFREALDRVIEQIDRRLYAQGAQADS